MEPSTYVFSGAELLSDSEDDSDDNDSLSSVSNSVSSEGSLHAQLSSHADIVDSTPAETDSEICSDIDRENKIQVMWCSYNVAYSLSINLNFHQSQI